MTTLLTGFSFTECPRWHEGRIWFSDFYNFRVLSAAPDGSDLCTEAEVPQTPAGIGWLPDGRLLVVSQRDQRLLRREADGSMVTHAELAGHIAGGNPNDMVVDHQGRAYVGNHGIDFAQTDSYSPANLVRVDPDGTVTVAADDLWFPNGTVITDNGTMIVAETFGNRMSAFDVAADGSLSNQRVWAQFADLPSDRTLVVLRQQRVVAPDGCCLDAEGAVWVADADGGPLRRVREGGEVLEEISYERPIYACMLGGDDGRTLFACSAADHRAEVLIPRMDASLVVTTVDVPRAGMP
jgi:sugar lactone lactonase YvrE